MVRNRIVGLLLAILVTAGATLVSAEAATSVKPISAPIISYSSNGYSFKATPAKWSDNGLSTFKWVLDGKTIAGAQSLSVKIPTSKKGSKLKFSETHQLENGTSSKTTSAELIVGKVNLADKIVIRVNPANDKMMQISELPQSIPTNYLLKR